MWSLTDRVCEAPHAQHKKYSAYPGPDGAKFAQGVIFFRHSAIDRMAMTDSGMVRPPTADQIGASESLMAPDRGSCYAGRMSLVATLAMLMLMLMPATAASIPAVKSAQCPPGYIVSGGYCTPMFRPAPGLRGPPFPGNGISRPETKAPKLPP